MLHPELELGVVYPQIELRGDPDAVRAIGAATEEAGYDHLVAYDHVLAAEHAGRDPELSGPYDEHDPFHDPLVLFSYLAGRTERLRFATGVIILPQRQTALFARQAADVAILSGGRLRVGAGVGWNWVEYDALGQDFGTRGRRLDEQVELLRRFWTEPVVSFAGDFDAVDRAGILPRPASPIPLWIGGFGEPALRRCARAGDGFIMGGSAEFATGCLRRLRELVADAGRSMDAVGAESLVRSSRGPEAVAARMRDWAEASGTHASVVTMGLGLDSTDAHVDYINRVAEELRRG